jgi:uncharacterized membrane protein YbhN (UPF0104 family)
MLWCGMRKAGIFFLKAGVSGLLVWMVVQRGGLEEIASRLARLPAATVVASLAIVAAQIALSAVRWRMAAAALGTAMPVPELLRIMAKAFFFNQTLPSTIGGDAYRIVAAHRLTGSLAKSVNGVVWDRIIGLAVLLAVVAATLPLLAGIAPPALIWALAGLAAAGLAGFAVVAAPVEWLERLLGRWAPARRLAEFVRAGHDVMHSGRLFAGIVIAALAAWALTVLNVLVIARGFSVPLGFLDFLVLVPPVALLITVPISIAGWGLREGGFVMMLGLVGIGAPDAAAISIAMGLLLAVAGLPGGVLLLVQRSGASGTTASDQNSMT